MQCRLICCCCFFFYWFLFFSLWAEKFRWHDKYGCKGNFERSLYNHSVTICFDSPWFKHWELPVDIKLNALIFVQLYRLKEKLGWFWCWKKLSSVFLFCKDFKNFQNWTSEWFSHAEWDKKKRNGLISGNHKCLENLNIWRIYYPIISIKCFKMNSLPPKFAEWNSVAHATISIIVF